MSTAFITIKTVNVIFKPFMGRSLLSCMDSIIGTQRSGAFVSTKNEEHDQQAQADKEHARPEVAFTAPFFLRQGGHGRRHDPYRQARYQPSLHKSFLR